MIQTTTRSFIFSELKILLKMLVKCVQVRWVATMKNPKLPQLIFHGQKLIGSSIEGKIGNKASSTYTKL